MTEEEAKGKWCPFSRVLSDIGGGASNRPSSGHYNCIASACMAWRRKPQTAMVRSATTDHDPFPVDRPSDYENNPSWEVVRNPLEGHCGLAGPNA